MTDQYDDELGRLLHKRVEPLAPPPGTFERIVTTARRRRQTRAVLTAAAVVVVMAGGVGAYNVVSSGSLAVLGTKNNEAHATTPPSPPAPSPASPRPVSPSPTPVVTPRPSGPRTAPLPATFQPQSVTFVSQSTGYALGSSPNCNLYDCSTLAMTSDGGHTWTGLQFYNLAVVPPGQSVGGVSQLRFAGQNGFAFGPDLFVTHNGSRTWKQIAVPRVYDLAVRADAYAVVDACSSTVALPPPNCAPGQLAVITSPAGTDDWKAVPNLAIRVGPNPQVRMAVSGTAVYVLAVGFNGSALYASVDGSTWTQARVPCVGSAVPVSMDAGGSVQLALACNDGTVYSSPDAGQTWQPRGSVAGSPTDVAITAHGIYVTATAKSTGAGAPLPGTIQVNTIGSGWTTVFRADKPLGFVGFTTDSQGFALPQAPDGHLFFTYDSGQTWAPVTPAATG